MKAWPMIAISPDGERRVPLTCYALTLDDARVRVLALLASGWTLADDAEALDDTPAVLQREVRRRIRGEG